jgi:hypothetical protein
MLSTYTVFEVLRRSIHSSRGIPTWILEDYKSKRAAERVWGRHLGIEVRTQQRRQVVENVDHGSGANNGSLMA